MGIKFLLGMESRSMSTIYSKGLLLSATCIRFVVVVRTITGKHIVLAKRSTRFYHWKGMSVPNQVSHTSFK